MLSDEVLAKGKNIELAEVVEAFNNGDPIGEEGQVGKLGKRV